MLSCIVSKNPLKVNQNGPFRCAGSPDRLPFAQNRATEEEYGEEIHEPRRSHKRIAIFPVPARGFVDHNITHEPNAADIFQPSEHVVVLPRDDATGVSSHTGKDLPGHDVAFS